VDCVRRLSRPAELKVDELGVVGSANCKVNARRLAGDGIGFPGTRWNQLGPERFLLTRVTSSATSLYELGARMAALVKNSQET
jgi:hypothetical protein